MKIISVERMAKGSFAGFYDDGKAYVSFVMNDGSIVAGHEYKKKDYKDYEHFVGVMSKFDPYVYFMKHPVEVDAINEEVLEKIWEDLNAMKK